MNGFVNCRFPGLFLGNTLFSYAHARGYAEAHGLRLHTEPWIGQKIFELDDPPCLPCLPGTMSFPPRRTEFDVRPDERDFEFHTYAQSRYALTYTRTQARSWFKFRPEILKILRERLPFADPTCSYEWVAHRRLGDYLGYGYVVVSEKSYVDFAKQQGAKLLVWKTEENPITLPELPGELRMLPDFWLMMNAKNLIRGNSSFSWWAATLGNANIFAPVIEGLEGGREHDCRIVEGNWPRFANLAFVTDLCLQP